VLAFTAHIIVAADVDPDWVYGRIRPWELSDAFTPPFLGELADKIGRRVNAIDMLGLAPPLSGPPPLPFEEILVDHPRVRRAQRYRDDIRVWTTEGGILTLGRGLTGRWEIGLEVDEGYRGRGLGRALAESARHLVPDGRPVWAQIAPGNAASVRALVAAGYRPVGMEALLVRHAGEH
jgi:GNAT superfamily N-acetyltransferase